MPTQMKPFKVAAVHALLTFGLGIFLNFFQFLTTTISNDIGLNQMLLIIVVVIINIILVWIAVLVSSMFLKKRYQTTDLKKALLQAALIYLVLALVITPKVLVYPYAIIEPIVASIAFYIFSIKALRKIQVGTTPPSNPTPSTNTEAESPSEKI
jgi:cytochrome c biogenesis protein CcdA